MPIVEELEIVKAKYESVKYDFFQISNELKSLSKSTTLTKGYIKNVLPFENELSGFKNNGKILKKPIYDINCYLYHFNDINQIILIEHMAPDLKKFHYFTMYFYYEDMIETMFWSSDILYNITHYIFKDDIITNFYRWALHGYSIGEYIYEDKLVKIFACGKEHKKTSEFSYFMNFNYDEKENLTNIIQSYPNGYARMIYPKIVEDYPYMI